MDLDRTRTWDMAPLARTITWDQPPLSGANTYPQYGQPSHTTYAPVAAAAPSPAPVGTLTYSTGVQRQAAPAPAARSLGSPLGNQVTPQIALSPSGGAATQPQPSRAPVPVPSSARLAPAAATQQGVPTLRAAVPHTPVGMVPSNSVCSQPCAPSQARAASGPAVLQQSIGPTSSQTTAEALGRSSTWSRAPSLPLDAVSASPADWAVPAAKPPTQVYQSPLVPAAAGQPMVRTRTGGLSSMPENATVSFATQVTTSFGQTASFSAAGEGLISRPTPAVSSTLPGTPTGAKPVIRRVMLSPEGGALLTTSQPQTVARPLLQRAMTASPGVSQPLAPVTQASMPAAVTAAGVPLQKTVTVDLGTVLGSSSRGVAGSSRARSQKPITYRAREPQQALIKEHERGDSVPPLARRSSGAAEAATAVLRPPTTSPPRRVFPSIPAPETKVSAHLPNGSALGRSPGLTPLARQLRIIVGGLMGSGKSTLCRMLRHLLGGQWVNQDEFADKKKGAKKAFLAEIERVARDKSIPVLLVDKINTMRQHRREIREAMDRGQAGDICLIQLRHPDDEPGQWRRAIDLCQDRIQGRGSAHRTLKGDEPKLRSILEMTAKGAEEMADEEQSWFKAQISANMTLDPVPLAMQVLSELDSAGLLVGYDIDDLLSEHRIMEALEAAKAGETALATAPNGAVAQKKPRSVWLWELELDQEACATVSRLWDEVSDGRPLEPIPRPHVTLLYIGGGSDKELATRHKALGGEEEARRFREDLESKEGLEVSFEVCGIAWDDRVAAAEVKGLSGMSANAHPHITLATAPKVPPVASNELLARRAAACDLETGLSQWLKELALEQYDAALRSWCSSMGAASPDEISENAADAAAAMEGNNAEERARIQALLERCRPGRLSYEELSPSQTLVGRVHAQRR